MINFSQPVSNSNNQFSSPLTSAQKELNENSSASEEKYDEPPSKQPYNPEDSNHIKTIL